MEKSADAFRTISEVADDLDLPQHVLRFWETRFQQIRPLKRAGGRRYYRPADIVLLRAIRHLLYNEGYTIKGVQRLLKEQGARGLGVAGPGASPQIEPSFEVPEDHGLDDEPDCAFEPDPRDAPPRAAKESHPQPSEILHHAGASANKRFGDPTAIREALVLIEACEAILAAARKPRT